MTNQVNKLDKITLPSGKNIKQCRQDSKRHKKKYSTTQALSLNHILSKNGEYSSWQDFIVRAKSLFSIFSNNKTKDIAVSPQTLFLSSSCSNMDNVIMNHWLKSLTSNEKPCDIVIDVMGDTLKYATVASALKEYLPGRNFRILNMTSENDEHKLSYTNTFEDDSAQLQQLLNASKHTLQSEDKSGALESPSDQEKIKHLSKPQKYNLFSLLERSPGEGFTVSEIFSSHTTTAVLLPSLEKSSDVVYNAFFDLLELIKKEQNDSGNPIRVTITGIPSTARIPLHLIKWLFNTESVQTIVHARYPSRQKESWTNKAIKLSSQSFLSFTEFEGEVPDSVNSLSSLLMNMKRNNRGLLPALELSKGVLVDSSVKLGFSPMPLANNIESPKHKNGNKLIE